ncbi:MAG: hypothetical protein ACFFCP_07595 [Promethearchaeota archaeon]
MPVKKQLIFFDEPIVRAKVSRIRFPKFCPVCGAPAERHARISAIPRRKVWLRPGWDPKLHSSNKNHLEGVEIKSFVVEVCQNHEMADNAELKLRGLTTLVTSIVASVSIFALIFAGSDYWARRPVSPWVYSYLLILTLSLLLGYLAFRPTPLETAIRIIGFDFELQHVWIKLKNHEYLEKLISENPMATELVNWIVKV